MKPTEKENWEEWNGNTNLSSSTAVVSPSPWPLSQPWHTDSCYSSEVRRHQCAPSSLTIAMCVLLQPLLGNLQYLYICRCWFFSFMPNGNILVQPITCVLVLCLLCPLQTFYLFCFGLFVWGKVSPSNLGYSWIHSPAWGLRLQTQMTLVGFKFCCYEN